MSKDLLQHGIVVTKHQFFLWYSAWKQVHRNTLLTIFIGSARSTRQLPLQLVYWSLIKYDGFFYKIYFKIFNRCNTLIMEISNGCQSDFCTQCLKFMVQPITIIYTSQILHYTLLSCYLATLMDTTIQPSTADTPKVNRSKEIERNP